MYVWAILFPLGTYAIIVQSTEYAQSGCTGQAQLHGFQAVCKCQELQLCGYVSATQTCEGEIGCSSKTAFSLNKLLTSCTSKAITFFLVAPVLTGMVTGIYLPLVPQACI